ncbi:hypothetical protein KFL_014610030 [Klebsormidium nitens]|uniref:Uncharacterized protein n=1 Tax=Klebsormidium nitens TaxID=105231 RepID=A0A1Y1IR68_KLENI|nr:hypothetical protein KFL_014610030 [Klebsormidium nitens]|eukprot:GAQ93350.1 hypothetical protein KFL_014610030 [Klebsormidium nitens]
MRPHEALDDFLGWHHLCVIYITKMIVPSVSDRTVDAIIKTFRPPNTRLGAGACAVLRGAIRSRMRKTAARSGVLALYARNGRLRNFTPTDVAMVDFIGGLQTEGALRHRLLHDAKYRDFFNPVPRPRRAARPPSPLPHVDEYAGVDFGGDDWNPDTFGTPPSPRATETHPSARSPETPPGPIRPVKRKRSERARQTPGARRGWSEHSHPIARRLDFGSGSPGAPSKRKRSERRRPVFGTQRRPARDTRRPARYDDYHGKIDLRKIRRDFKRVIVPKTRDNMFAAVRRATRDARSVRELREACADLEMDPARFWPDAVQRMKGPARAKAHAASVRKDAMRGVLELEVLAYATCTVIVVKDGDELRRYEPRVFGGAGPSREPPTAVLERTRYYDVLTPRG